MELQEVHKTEENEEVTSIPTKRCSKCKAVKPRSEFHRHAAKPDGLAMWCKVCRARHKKGYYAKNRMKLIADSVRWIEEHWDHVKEVRRRRWLRVTDREREHRSKLQKNRAAKLTPCYVRGVMRWKDAPTEIVALKTLQLKMHRALNQSENRSQPTRP